VLFEPEIFQGIFNLVKENLTAEELNNMLLATDNKGRTFFQMAANLSKPEIFQ